MAGTEKHDSNTNTQTSTAINYEWKKHRQKKRGSTQKCWEETNSCPVHCVSVWWMCVWVSVSWGRVYQCRGRSASAVNGIGELRLNLALWQLWRVRASSRPLPPLPCSPLYSLRFPLIRCPNPFFLLSFNPSLPWSARLLVRRADKNLFPVAKHITRETIGCSWFTFMHCWTLD